MKSIGRFCFLVLASGMALAQANPPSSSTVADDLKAMREAIAAQQKQIAQQQQQIESLTKALDAKTTVAPHVENAALTNNAPVNNTPNIQSDADKPKESPLSFRIGGAEFTPGGFLDFENVFRSTNTGNVAATNFWAIPFSNTPAGRLTEYRSTGQYSRINLKVTSKYHGSDITGYVEADFNGNDAANVFVTSNPHTMRARLYWADFKRGKIELLAGQTWGLQTPNRVGISPAPADLAVTIGEDAQTHVGLNYTRAAAIRFGYHFSDKFVWAVEAQNPQQFVGQGAEVAFPAQFATALGTQLDNAAVAGVPNLSPDIITKFAYDSTIMGGSHHFHFEAGGLMTTAKVAVTPSLAGAAIVTHSLIGGGLLGAANIEVVKNVRFLASGMYGPGTGRYMIGMGPQVVVVPVAAVAGGACLTGATGGCDAHLSPIHAGDILLGTEIQMGPKSQVGAYYGGAYFARNAFPDLSAAGAVKPIIGFGGAGQASPTVQNKAIQEGTVDFIQTFWKNPQFGSVLTVLQASYITRAPWFVAAGQPKNAHLMQGYVSLRYVLP